MDYTNKVIDKLNKQGLTAQASMIKEILIEYEGLKKNGASDGDLAFFETMMGFFGIEAYEELCLNEAPEKEENKEVEKEASNKEEVE